MRGYISFLLVFAALFSFFYLLLMLINTYDYNQSESITIEYLYQTEMNIKEVVRESARQSARDAFYLYVAEAASIDEFDIKEAKNRVRNAVYDKLRTLSLSLSNFYNDENISAVLWCSIAPITSFQLTNSKKNSVDLKNAAPCTSCLPLQNEQCRDLIDVEIELDSNALKNSIVAIDLSHFGVSLYSEKYNIAAAGYIPIDGKVVVQ